MDILNTGDIIAKEGYRVAPNLKARILEAAKLFNEGMNSSKPFAGARLQEAFSTSDFPILLGKAFDVETLQSYQDTPSEWQKIAVEKKVKDFEKKKLVDLFGGKDYLDDVKEKEEYKGRDLSESEAFFHVGKTGNTFGLSWELRLRREFSDLADFPGRLGAAARVTEDQKVFQAFVSPTGPNTEFFKTENGNAPSNKKLTSDNLKAAYVEIVKRKNKEKNPISWGGGQLQLVIPRTLVFEAEAALLPMIPDPAGGNVSIPNVLNGKFEIVVSDRIAVIDQSANVDTTWYILPPKNTPRPALVKGTLIGNEQPDIRVKRDQGERTSGGAVPVDDGSFGDDTIWYRARHSTGGAAIFGDATYASTGTTA